MRRMLPFAPQRSLFRAYDIRGAWQFFTPVFVRALGATYAQLYKLHDSSIEDSHVENHSTADNGLTHNYNSAHGSVQNPQPTLHHHQYQSSIIVIGYDVRCGSDTIAQTLADILQQQGFQVIRLGLITTPMMAFWAQQYAGHGIMVTASHSAKDILGIKWLVANQSPSAADINNLYQSLLSSHSHKAIDRHKAVSTQKVGNSTIKGNKNNNIKQSSVPAANAHTNNSRLSKNTVATAYIDTIAQVFNRIHGHNTESVADDMTALAKLDLTVVIDCMHGATSNIAQPLFARFCKQVIMLNDTPDGNFPTGNPDPTEPNRLAELQQTVIINAADIGLAFDGDGDRLMIVDNRGKVVAPDHLLYLLAQVALTERPEPTKYSAAPQVLFDVKCSHHLSPLLTQLGAIPVMSKTGSSLMRQQLQSSANDAIFAGELSGHFIFNDGYFIIYDDAMYAGLRLLHWLVHTAANLNIATILNTAIDADVNTDTKINTEASVNTVPIATDSWGELRPTLSPYQLTDITHNLPVMVSTADHYLPLDDDANTSCTIIEHLAEFCRYLQRLVEGIAFSPVPFLDNSHNGNFSLMPSLSSSCFANNQYTTTAQAQHLLPAGTQLSCIDGVRLDFAHGFGVLRQSNTSHSLTVRFAGDSIDDLKNIQAHFVALCHSFDSKLAAQIAIIGH